MPLMHSVRQRHKLLLLYVVILLLEHPFVFHLHCSSRSTWYTLLSVELLTSNFSHLHYIIIQHVFEYFRHLCSFCNRDKVFYNLARALVLSNHGQKS